MVVKDNLGEDPVLGLLNRDFGGLVDDVGLQERLFYEYSYKFYRDGYGIPIGGVDKLVGGLVRESGNFTPRMAISAFQVFGLRPEDFRLFGYAV